MLNLKYPSLLAVAVGTAATTPALAAGMTIKLTLPTIESSGSRPPARPYVAVWARHADGDFAGNLAVWYQIEDHHRRRGGDGTGSQGGPGGPPPWEQHGGQGDGPPRGPESGPPPVRSENTPGGARWLNGLRQWWADSGHALKFPVDGLTSASRPAGTYELTFASDDPKLAGLPPGQYQLMIEVAREHGGDETVSIPFTWPIKAAQGGQVSGKSELGSAQLSLAP